MLLSLWSAKAGAGCTAVVADAMRLTNTFARDQFDVVVSSECIEHVPSPAAAIGQMLAVLKPGGLLSLSTPHVLWQPVVRLATALRLRPFDGHENFSSWSAVRRALRSHGATIVAERGLHLFPFQFGLHPLSRWCDRHLQAARPLMINICVLARKNGSAGDQPRLAR